MKNKSQGLEATALAAFTGRQLFPSYFSFLTQTIDLETGKPTKAKVSRAIRAVAKWKECAELFSTPDNIKKAEDMLAELEAILEGLGAKLDKKVERQGTVLSPPFARP